MVGWKNKRNAADPNMEHGEPVPWEAVYGAFTSERDVRALPITGLDKESGWIHRFIVEFVDRIRSEHPVVPLLLPGEYNRVRDAYCEWLGIGEHEIVTTGLGDDVDVHWDFEGPIPRDLGTFSLVLSQAMLEHLIDPYKHVSDLYSLVRGGGSLVMMTHSPGFPYHRYPVDCIRFFPDWFESVADRLGAAVAGRLVADDRILYHFTKSI